MKEIKRFEDWKGLLEEFLQVGDLVDQVIVDEFINVMPPACMTGDVIQMGEAYSHHNGRQTYPTLKKTPDGWAYAGACFRGGEAPTITIRFTHEDDWGRKTYENVNVPGSVYKMVDDRLHAVTDDGEPLAPLKRELNIIVANADEEQKEGE